MLLNAEKDFETNLTNDFEENEAHSGFLLINFQGGHMGS